MGAEDDIFKLMRRMVICVSVLTMASVMFDWVRFSKNELTLTQDEVAGLRTYTVTVYSILGMNLVEGIAVFFLGLLAIGGVLVFRHMDLKWAAAVVPLCGLAITGVAVYSAIFVSSLAGDVEPADVRVGLGLWFILFAGPLILAVSSMMALEVFRPKFWLKFGRA